MQLFEKKRKLDNFFEAEEKLMSKATLENSLSEMINDPECRLFVA
jgi:hypothetical protein